MILLSLLNIPHSI